ncbi:cell division protein ZapA [Comamonas aquatica]|uniref:Cell division protein ZapA n=1 Tax=Comamonas aquatica TaxID=225991 RepID=A0AA42W446_9BURK|nr:cell division protein ZapA [Comamonas aquatica]MDH1427970.1 cell division protein ZapA [Comamonas aquatica]MDH1605985.1 cell division protein ZapA [Comamonas aquatica]MDH1616355.1 cell division protein ZapA [Comamonas aquatica]MDH2005894.1 cell division protein ZapA [Comamonas aquatica]
MSQIEIQILHQDYLLTCPDGQENQLLEAVERVDQQFQHMRNTSKLRSRERVGVLLAVNLAYENLELRKQLQALQQQLADVQELGDAGLPDIAEPDPLLLALQAQAEHDAHLAAQLLHRLDTALTPVAEPDAPSYPTQLQVQAMTAAPQVAQAEIAFQTIPDSLPGAATLDTTASAADLDNDIRVELLPAGSQAL